VLAQTIQYYIDAITLPAVVRILYYRIILFQRFCCSLARWLPLPVGCKKNLWLQSYHCLLLASCLFLAEMVVRSVYMLAHFVPAFVRLFSPRRTRTRTHTHANCTQALLFTWNTVDILERWTNNNPTEKGPPWQSIKYRASFSCSYCATSW